MRGRRAFIAALVVVAVVPATAGAAPRWFAPQPISPFGWAIADAEIDPAGKSVALLASNAGLATTTRAPGGAFTAPQGLPYVTGSEPQLGIDDQGGVVVAWRAQPSGIRQATVRGPTGGWQPPVDLSPPDDFNSNLWTLDVGSDGTAAVAWLNGRSMRVRVRPPNGDFGPIEDVPLGGRSLYLDAPRLHVDGAGGVHLFMGAYGGELLHAERPPGGQFGDVDVLLTDAAGAPGDVASSAGGALVVSWARVSYENGPPEFTAALFVRDSDDAEFGAVETLPESAGAMAIADDSSMQFAWPTAPDSAGRSEIRTVRRSANGQFGPVTTISSTSEQVTQVALGMDDAGETTAVWQQGVARSNIFQAYAEPKRIHAATRPADGEFGAPVVLSPTTVRDQSALSVSRSGTAVAIWTETGAGPTCVKAVVRAETSLPGNAATCAQVPAPIVPGGSPDVTPPGLKFGGSRTVKLAGPHVTLTASCTEACVLSATGSISTGGAARTYKLKGAKTKLLPAGKKAKLKLKLSKRSFKAVKRALKRKRKVKAVIKITARDEAGVKRTVKRTLKLKRGR